MTAPIPVDVELSGPLAAAAAQAQALESRMTGRLDAKLPKFGVPGSVAVTVRAGEQRRALGVRVNGSVQPYPLGLLARSWQTIAPAEAHGFPYEQEGGDPAAADDRWVAALATKAGTNERQLVGDFAVEATVQVVTRRPQALLGDSQFSLYREAASGDGQQPEGDAEAMKFVARFLLALGVSIADKRRVGESVRALGAAGLPKEDVAEITFERLRSRAIEIHCQPGYLASIAGGDLIEKPASVHADQFSPRARAAFESVERELFEALGLRTPDVNWVPESTFGGPAVSIRINHRASPAVHAPRAGTLHVAAPPHVVRAHSDDVDAEPFFDAVHRRRFTLVPEDAADRLAATDLEAKTPVEWVATALRHESRARAGDLLGVEDVEYHMARLDEHHSDLVAAVLAEFPLADVTRILRALLREGYSIKDLLTIAERLLLYEEIELDELHDLVFDARFPVTAAMADRPRWVRQFEFVRAGIAPLAVKRRGRALDAVDVMRVDPTLERRAMDVAYKPPGTLRSWLDDDAQTRLCDAARHALEQSAPGSAPVVLTPRWARGGIREVLTTELPDLAVLSYEDLLPGTEVTTHGQLVIKQ